MIDFKTLAERIWAEYCRQPGLQCVLSEGEPGVGLRYSFADDCFADRFLTLRNMHHSFTPENANALRKEGMDVVEIWRR